MALGTVGCGDPIKFGQDLDQARVLGVQLEGAAGRASAQPGKDVRLEVLLAGADGPVATRVALTVCEASDSARGVPSCDGRTYTSQKLDSSTRPSLSFTVPDDAPQERRLAVLGVACEDGEPHLGEEPLDFGCVGSKVTPLRFSLDAIVLDDTDNINPDLSGLSVDYAGDEAQLEPTSQTPTCEGALEVGVGEVFEIAIELGERARQVELDELLQVSHFSTAGRYERQYTVLDDPSAESSFLLEWEAPLEPGPVKHYLVVRDDAGGVSFASWSVCAR